MIDSNSSLCGGEAEASEALRSRDVLSLVADESSALLVRAAFHLIGRDVREAATVATLFAQLESQPPELVVVDDSACGEPACRRLSRTASRADVPVLHVRPPFEPLELLGEADAAVPGLYEVPASTAVQLTSEEQLALLTHDLRRVIEDGAACRVERDHGWMGTALGLVDVLALRDIETSQHSFRVRSYARALANLVEPSMLTDTTVELGFLLHDVGKLALPDSILFKPGPLTAAEWKRVQTHPAVGAGMVEGILPVGGQAISTVRSHHERWDGRGYPDGLSGQAIPLAARIFAVADTLDAVTSDRPYRRRRSWAEAIDVVRAGAGHQFDPAVVVALSANAARLQSGWQHLADLRKEL